MKKKGFAGICLMALLASVVVLAGCCADQPAEPMRPAPTRVAAPAPRPAPAAADPCAGTGELVRTTGALPTYDKNSSVVLVEKSAPAKVIVGKEFAYQLRVVNLTRAKLEEVSVTQMLPGKFKFARAEPKAEPKAGKLTWDLGTLGPKQAQAIAVHGTATDVGKLTPCVTVTYRNPPVCLTFQAVKPELKLVKTAPKEVLVCETIPVRLVVSNEGTGHACNVKVRDALPAGLTTVDGKSALMFNAGTLGPGQSRAFSAELKAAKTGTYVNRATASGDGGLTTQASSTTVVRQPVLVLTKTGPKMRFVGRPATYEIAVKNKGDTTARSTVLTDTLPTGATFVSASDGGRHARGTVIWSLGDLPVNGTKKVSVTVRADATGTLRNLVSAKAVCAQASASATTEVAGIPAILLECIDVEDPIEVGAQENYVITVTNQGSAVGTNIVVKCTLPAEQEFISAAGPVKETIKGKEVTFGPLRSLAAKAKATYRVVVKGVKAGDVRFKVSLTSDQMTSPAEETESTHIYE